MKKKVNKANSWLSCLSASVAKQKVPQEQHTQCNPTSGAGDDSVCKPYPYMEGREVVLDRASAQGKAEQSSPVKQNNGNERSHGKILHKA